MRSLLTVALLLAFTPFVKADANMEAEAALHLAMAQAKLKAPTPGPTVSPPTPIFAPEITRSPVGHTHTCANGHTWDHSVTAGHNCPACGLSQYVQDSRPKAINLGTAQFKTYSLNQGGCANGNCQTTTTRGGFFRRP